MRYWVQPREQIFVKGFGFLPFAKNVGRNIGKNISKNLVVNTVKNFSIMLSNLQQIRSAFCNFNLLQNAIQKTAEATADLIGNEIANKIGFKRFTTK